MKYKKNKLGLGLLAVVVLSLFGVTQAWANYSFVVNQSLYLSSPNAFAGDKVKLYTVVVNNDFASLSADVEFYNNDKLIGATQVVDLGKEGARQAWIEYVLPEGENKLRAVLTNFSAKNEAGKVVPIKSEEVAGYEANGQYSIDLDTDGDDVGNKEDADDDNDSLTDADESTRGTDPLKVDTDGDTLSDGEEVNKGLDPTKKDTDGDGHDDQKDLFPVDKAEWADGDKDGIGDNSDPDDDNDGLTDTEENELGSDPLKADTDEDGLTDKEEKDKGTDPTKADTDGDGLNDGEENKVGSDPLLVDTDLDGVNDLLDAFPLDKNESVDTDLDGVGNNADADDDGDGILDTEEKIKGTDPIKADTDSDGLSDNYENENGINPLVADTDGDGKMDGYDKEPLVANQDWIKLAVQFGALGSFFLFLFFFSLAKYKKRKI